MPVTGTPIAVLDEPVSLDEAKAHLRVAGSDEDTLIESLITSARQWAERFTARAFLTTTLTEVLDMFPDDDEIIRLPTSPLQSVPSITYIDTAGAVQTWDPANRLVDTHNEPGRISLAYGKSYPTTREIINAVTITYVVGYGTASDVPKAIKQAILLLVGHWYEHREAAVDFGVISKVPDTVEFLLWPYRVWEAA
jgi:uncharacterized phiE125 gp8 family phage protein